ncbi:MAG: hypothetical protein PVF91_05835 [Chromatiales bacterium]|jgi:hypothetical protein
MALSVDARAVLRGAGVGLALCLTCVGGVQADAGWTGYGYVEELRADQFGRFEVRLDVDDNPTDCRNGRWFYRGAITGSELMYRALLEAVSARKRVRVYVTGLCDIKDYSEISSAAIAP